MRLSYLRRTEEMDGGWVRIFNIAIFGNDYGLAICLPDYFTLHKTTEDGYKTFSIIRCGDWRKLKEWLGISSGT